MRTIEECKKKNIRTWEVCLHGIGTLADGYEDQYEGVLPQEGYRAVSGKPEGAEDVRPVPWHTGICPTTRTTSTAV